MELGSASAGPTCFLDLQTFSGLLDQGDTCCFTAYLCCSLCQHSPQWCALPLWRAWRDARFGWQLS
jgi:hypothetical protein